MAIGKRLKKAREGVDREKLYPLADAIKMVKERAKSKFDETIEIAINLGVDPRHADQMVRGVVTLPNGTGRSLRVAMQRSKSMLPPCTRSTRSSAPTTSAPAALASSALAPRANTATRSERPVPFGNVTTPRTIWSA